MRKPPAYRKKAGRDTAIVALTDAQTGERREYRLGTHDTNVSREAYHRLVAQWEANGRRLPEVQQREEPNTSNMTLEALCLEYWLDVKDHKSDRELAKLRSLMRLLCQYHGSTMVDKFGPRAMSQLIKPMAAGDPETDPPRRSWGRLHINQQLARVRHMFKWGVAREMIPPGVYQSIAAMDNVRRGTTGVAEPGRVLPVELAIVERTKPHLSRQLQTIIDLQLHTGARAGELLIMRPMDINRDSEVWVYTPTTHKSAHKGKMRKIYLGPSSQQAIIPWLDRQQDTYMFSPAEAEIERIGQLPDRSNKPGECYTIQSYAKATVRAARRAFPAPLCMARKHHDAWHREHRWTPHQLRHTAATRIRASHGLEAAQLILGHSSAMITDAIYAERDTQKVLKIAQVAS